jgi:hypothetical protein
MPDLVVTSQSWDPTYQSSARMVADALSAHERAQYSGTCRDVDPDRNRTSREGLNLQSRDV